ncbi:MAG TPA: MXAN_6577-like cysteine-rich protein [Polyangiaceae bacterium]|nr:MXAN_6577-like cysteine-rich protein [Polyangiaceae bacterium]
MVLGSALLALACSAKVDAPADTTGGAHGGAAGAGATAAMSTASGGAAGNAAANGGAAGMASLSCPAGQAVCGGACANLQTDGAHCGACTTACANGMTCQNGACQAPCGSGLTSCGGTCLDTDTSAQNCGGCGMACGAGQTCVAGKCACPSGGILCGTSCVDTQTDGQNCGGCAKACGAMQTCTAGACACSNGLSACGTACVDTTTSNDHCGGCNQPCQNGMTCSGGACQCAAGQTACSGACVDTTTNAANCGACGTACSMGQVCLAGVCTGAGGVGADGCTGGLAENLTLSRIDAFQSTQISIMTSGAEVPATMRNTDLVAGRETVFRLFVTPGSSFAARDISARVTIVNDAASDEFFTKQTVSKASTIDDANSTIQVTVPADKITADSQYHVELVECSTLASGDAAAPRFPTTNDLSLGVRTTGGLKITVIPISIGGKAPPTDDTFYDQFRSYMLAMYPITAITISAGTGITFAAPSGSDWSQLDWNGMLDSVRSKRQSDAPAADVYYFGMIMPTDTFQQFCGRGCTAGIGFVAQQNDAGHRAAVGIGWSGAQAQVTMAHEVGHNHGRNHAPCVPQGESISGVDPYYPYQGGAIGVWGYNSNLKMLLNPTGVTDIMGYCSDQWISDYTYDGLVNRVAFVDGAQRVVENPAALARFRTLLVDAHGPRWGLPSDGLVLPEGEPETAEIFDAKGDVIDYVTVYRSIVSDIDAASIMVPEPQPGWYAIQVSGSTPHPFAAAVAIKKGF